MRSQMEINEKLKELYKIAKQQSGRDEDLVLEDIENLFLRGAIYALLYCLYARD